VVEETPQTMPEHLREERTEVTEDGAVSEIIREVQLGPGKKTNHVFAYGLPAGLVTGFLH